MNFFFNSFLFHCTNFSKMLRFGLFWIFTGLFDSLSPCCWTWQAGERWTTCSSSPRALCQLSWSSSCTSRSSTNVRTCAHNRLCPARVLSLLSLSVSVCLSVCLSLSLSLSLCLCLRGALLTIGYCKYFTIRSIPWCFTPSVSLRSLPRAFCLPISLRSLSAHYHYDISSSASPHRWLRLWSRSNQA